MLDLVAARKSADDRLGRQHSNPTEHRSHLINASNVLRLEPDRPRCVRILSNVVEIQDPVSPEWESIGDSFKDRLVRFCESKLKREESEVERGEDGPRRDLVLPVH